MSPMRSLLLLLVFTIGVFLFYIRVEPKTPPAGATRRINYSITVSNQTNQVLSDLTVKVFHPLKNTPWQQTSTMDASASFSPLTSTNTEYLVFHFLLPPYGRKVIQLNSTVELWSEPRNARGPSIGDSAPLFDPKKEHALASLAASLQGNSSMLTARQIFSWINKNISGKSYAAEIQPAAAVLAKREGDCTDLAALYATLARANGVAARVAAGFVVDRDMRLKAIAYHNWAEFYDGGTWKLADPIQGVFDAKYENYITFGYLDALPGTGKFANPERFGASSTEVQIKMD